MFLAFYSHFQVTCGQMTSLPSHLRSPEVTWHHFLSRDCLLLRLQPCRMWYVQCMWVLAFYSHFQVTSGQMMSLPGHFRSFEVTSRHLLSPDCLLLRATALLEAKCTKYEFWLSTLTSRWLSIKWHHFRVSSGHLRSHDVISCLVTASSCKLQRCRM